MPPLRLQRLPEPERTLDFLLFPLPPNQVYQGVTTFRADTNISTHPRGALKSRITNRVLSIPRTKTLLLNFYP